LFTTLINKIATPSNMKTFSYLIVAALVVLAALTTAEAQKFRMADASPLASEGAERYYFKNRYVCKTKPC